MDKEQLQGLLREIESGGSSTNYGVMLERHQVVGELPWWEEKTSIGRGKNQRFQTLRSFVDEGGAPIGIWEDESVEEHISEIIKALITCKVWNVKSDEIAPGQECVIYTFVIGEGEYILVTSGDSMNRMVLAEVDMLFKRVSYNLLNSGKGAAVVCHMDAPKNENQAYSIQLQNIVNEAVFIRKPLLGQGTEHQHLRIEYALTVDEVTGQTGEDLKFIPVDSEYQTEEDPEKHETSVEIPPGESFTITARPQLPKNGKYYVRAVYTNYLQNILLDRHFIRGRVFSRSKLIER